jgi:cell wall assembly regulator SMI1
MLQLVERIDEWLRTYRPSYYEYLQPPLTDAQVSDFESFVGTPLREDLRILYQWKGGQSGISPEPLYDGRTFMQLEEIREAVRANNELLEMGVFEQENWWHPHWVPFLTDGGGNFLCVDLEGAFAGQPGQLLTFWSESPVRNIEYPSLSSFLSNLLEGFAAALEGGTLSGMISIPYPSGYPILNRSI